MNVRFELYFWRRNMKRNKRKKVGRIVLTILAVLIGTVGVLLFSSERWMRKTWPNLNMEELVYQLKAPIAGTSHDLLMSYVWSCAVVTGIVLVLLILVNIMLRKKSKAKSGFGLFCICAGIAATVYSVHDVWAALDIKNYMKNQSTYNTVVEDNYVDPSRVNITFPEQKRNLIYIYLESMENTYADKASGGAFDKNYIPELTQLAQDNISFSNSEQMGGGRPTVYATWTIAGIFAQTSGLPLNIGMERNEMAYQDSFFPEITTMGDILKDAGYQQYFFIGSIGQFGGRQNYFEEHGDYEVDDYDWAIEQGLIPEGYYEWWGYEDEKLFAFAKDRLTAIAAEGEPFNFTMLTADTHFEDGYPCELCDQENEGDNQYGMVLHCSSKQVTEFVSWIQQQDFYDNTTIVISGDHLTMDSDFCADIDPNYTRTVYNVIINSAVQPQQEKNRNFTTMDMFPTTLASLGASIEGEHLGLGTNLFSGEQTLSEKMGFDELNSDLSQKSKFFEKLNESLQSVWTHTDEGWKFYIEEEGRYAKGEWVSMNPHRYANDEEQKYYIDENGYAVQGWKLIDGKWYYFSQRGSYRLLEGPCDAPYDVDETQYS